MEIIPPFLVRFVTRYQLFGELLFIENLGVSYFVGILRGGLSGPRIVLRCVPRIALSFCSDAEKYQAAAITEKGRQESNNGSKEVGLSFPRR